jgi:signal transduction histidine kinase
MNNSVETVRLIAQKKQLQVEVHASPLLPLLLLDEKRIQQVLDNLLSNAVKFTPSGGTVAVSTRLRGEDGSGAQWVEVRVTDSGIGVPPEDVERIFRKFYQSPLSKEQSWRGTGLGLAIARYVVEAHGGKIWVESQVGEGATFIFTLPVGKMEAHERTASQLIPQMAGSNAA